MPRWYKRLKAWLCITGEFVGPVKPRDPAPCGDDEDHYYWTETEGWPCPACYHKEKRKKEKCKQEAQAERIATLVTEKLNNHRRINRVRR